MNAKTRPHFGEIYSTREVLENLILEDSPFLMVYPFSQVEYQEEPMGWNLLFPGHAHLRVAQVKAVDRSPIQLSHLTDQQILEKVDFADKLRWKYIRTTQEWCPVFYFAGEQRDLRKVIRVEHSVDEFQLSSLLRQTHFWVQPNFGETRSQYHCFSQDDWKKEEPEFLLDDLFLSKEENLAAAKDKGYVHCVQMTERVIRDYDGFVQKERTYFRHYKEEALAEQLLFIYSNKDTLAERAESYGLYRTVTK